jgi:hypothetical protein
MMAKDKGQVRRVLQILSPEDQETLAILHHPPVMEELLRRQETLAEIMAAGLRGGVVESLPGMALPVRLFPAVLDELTVLPEAARHTLQHSHIPALVAAPQDGLALTQLFQGLWVSICTVDSREYRIVYDIDRHDASVTLLMVGNWASLEERLEGT